MRSVTGAYGYAGATVYDRRVQRSVAENTIQRSALYRRTLKTLAAPVCLFFVLGVQLLVRVSILHNQYDVEHKRSQIVALQNEIQQERLTLVQETRPDILRDRALQDLALSSVDTPRLRQVRIAQG